MIDPPDPRRAFKFLPAPIRPLVFPLVRRAIVKRLEHQGMGVRPAERVQLEVREMLQHLTALLEDSSTEFLLGATQPMLADLAVFAQIDGLYWKPLPRAMALVEEFPVVMSWYRTVNAATRGRNTAPSQPIPHITSIDPN